MGGKYQAYPEYKDSGLAWLGEMPVHWLLRKSKYLFSKMQRPVRKEDGVVTAFRDGQVTLRSNRRTEGFTESIKEIGYQGVRVGDLLVHAMDGFAGAIGVSDSDGKCSPVCSVCVPISLNQIHMTYYGYLVRQLAVTDYISSLAKGIRERSTEFRYSEFSILDLCVPPINEQEKIARFLVYETGKIDTLIDKQQQLIQLLKEKRQAVISHAVTKGLNPNAPMRDSGVEWLGEVPEHWVVTPLKFLINDRKGAVKAGPFGSHLKNSDMEGSDIKVISQRNIISRDLDIGESMISFNKYRELQGFTIFKNDILVTTRGTIGRTLVYDRNNLAILHPCLIRLQVKSDFVFSELIALIIQESGYAMEQILLNSNATTIEVIYSENLINTMICLPLSLLEQQEILDYISEQKNNFDHLIGKAQSAIDLMQERRTALISAAVTGKIDVRHHVSHPTGNDTSEVSA